MAASGDLGDMQGQSAHAFDVGDDLDGSDDGPQVPGHRGLECQQHEGRLLGAGAGGDDLFMIADHLFGEYQVGLQQGLGSALHGDPRHSAHLGELVGQRVKLLVVRGTHDLSVRPSRGVGAIRS